MSKPNHKSTAIETHIKSVCSKISKRHREIATNALLGAWSAKAHRTKNGWVKSWSVSRHALVKTGGEIKLKLTGSVNATGRFWHDKKGWSCSVVIEKELERAFD
jgi:hypothetical protein